MAYSVKIKEQTTQSTNLTYNLQFFAFTTFGSGNTNNEYENHIVKLVEMQ